VRENIGGGETKVDIEALFNTVISNRERIQSLFSGSDRITKGELS